MQRIMLLGVMVIIACTTTFADEYTWKQPTYVEGETIPVEDGEIYYECYGDPKNEPLLLIHGFSSTGRETWTPVIEEFSQKYRLIIPDLRGHGRSINRADEFMHRRSALDIIALLDHLDIETVQAMGVSSGAMTLIHMAIEKPKCLEAMVLNRTVSVGRLQHAQVGDEGRDHRRFLSQPLAPRRSRKRFRSHSSPNRNTERKHTDRSR